MTPSVTATPALRPRCLAVDLEVGAASGRLHKIGACRPDTGERFLWQGGNLQEALDRLDALAAGAAFVLGHNIIHFDLPQLAALRPGLRLLQLPAVDTLWLNPLAFPRNPYHHLIKHYKDGALATGRHPNDPQKDAELAVAVFGEQHAALQALDAEAPELVAAWHWLTTRDDAVSGINRFFMKLRRQPRPDDARARAAIARRLDGQACHTARAELLADPAPVPGWPLAFALAWLSVAGGNSVMPPWVRHQFPAAGALLRRLRDTACTDAACDWCRERHDAVRELRRWFGFAGFRPQPADAAGKPLQQGIAESALAGRHVLGILPTGTGKSLCYQIPALSRFEKTGALTVVISPLVALMADQVAGLKTHNIEACAAINGLLSLPERADVLDRVRLGDVGILLVAPEQLRNRTLRRVLEQREIGAWVIDEAHCLSKWGHDFRPDYRYVSRFIREKAGDGPIPPILCLTATAKPDVIADMLGHFREKLGIDLLCLDGGARRDNLDFLVAPTTPAAKFEDVFRWIERELPAGRPGGAIVYCATRGATEEVAAFLRHKGLAAAHFHARVPPETKKEVQAAFIRGELRVIAATNAFGMGIDKPDVRLVIHADIPGSLENYLQEAGRAGRDRETARCVLLYTPEDVERQFGMSARSRLSRKEISVVLKALRRLEGKKRRGDHGWAAAADDGAVVATAGEILAEDEEAGFTRDSATDDTRVRTAVSWLEEAELLTREENRVQIFPSSLRVASAQEARDRLAGRRLDPTWRRQLLVIIDALIAADPDEGISTDELLGVTGLSSARLRQAFADLEDLGLASNDTALTAFVHAGVTHGSRERARAASALEKALIAAMRELAPDFGKGDAAPLHLRLVCQRLKDEDFATALPETLRRLVMSLAADGRDEEGGVGSLAVKRLDGESLQVTLQRDWPALEETAKRRQLTAAVLLEHLLGTLPPGARGADLLAETTLGRLTAALAADLTLAGRLRDPQKAIERALLWLHEQEAIRLNKGLAVFRPAMTIRLERDWKKQFGAPDFEPLRLHYDEQVLQVHVMAEYVKIGLEKMADALRLAMDYFTLPQAGFLERWFAGRQTELQRQTTPASWRAIVEALGNKAQRDIVADPRETANVLVLAGPGSGKTRVLVHRIAWLIRCRRENPRSILALAYNRHAAAEIRRRLHALIGDEARGVIALTLDALAMRLTGASFADRREPLTEDTFRRLREEAIALLRGTVPDGAEPPDGDAARGEADALRESLLGGFRWILVDEYQDVGPGQYELIAAIVGRKRPADERINLLAVGDDDQNIYAFAGASIEFIRRFETDYAAKPAWLTDNYRSTAHIVATANALIEPVAGRMKAGHPLRINRQRAKEPPGGDWQARDPVGRGRVQIITTGHDAATQALAIMAEFERLAALAADWDWSRCAVIAPQWKWLEPLRSHCCLQGIPVHWAGEDGIPFWRLRETQAFLAAVENASRLTDVVTLRAALAPLHAAENPWHALLGEAVDDFALEAGTGEVPLAHFREWLAEWGREARRRQHGLLLVTAHGAKGLEFDHVIVADGDWSGREDDAAVATRLYYVAMTRARQTLALARFADHPHRLLAGLKPGAHLLHREPLHLPAPPAALARRHVAVGLDGVDLGHAGRRPAGHPLHQAIARLQPGMPLHLRQDGERWLLHDDAGVSVGRMARAFVPPAGMACVAATVKAVVVRDKSQDTAMNANVRHVEPRCERWEVVVPELVFAPASPA